MNDGDYIEVYDRLANSLLNNNLNFFIGAGFSYYFGYPSWKELLNQIIDEVGIRAKLTETTLFPFIQDDAIVDREKVNDIILNNLLGVDYLRLAGYIDILVPESIHKYVIEAIKRSKMRRVSNTSTKEFINFFENYSGYIDDIITTNYDDNIEFCFKNDISVVNRDKKSLGTIRGKQRLYKIHGCVNSVIDEFLEELGIAKYSDNIVITEKDYNNFKNSNLYLFYKVFSLFTEKKTLFLGYSINDPNIRALLNDVIEEAGEDFKPELFWVTRDYLSDLDKDYLRKNFELTIIEGVELKDFFNTFNSRIIANREIRELNNKELSEFVKQFLDNSDDAAYRKDMLSKSFETKLEALKLIYTELITTKRSKYLEILLDLLLTDRQIEERFELQLSNLMSSDINIIYDFVNLVISNNNYYELIIRRSLQSHFVMNVINFAGKPHSFGYYAKSIEMLLEVYRLFKEYINEFEDLFVDELVYNIRNSTDDDGYNNRYKGYDYRGLGEVANYIKCLDEMILDRLLEKLTNDYLDIYRVKQLFYIIKYSNLTLDKKKLRILDKIIYPLVKSDIYEYIFRYIDRLIRKYFDFIAYKDNVIVVLEDTFDFFISKDNDSNAVIEFMKNEVCIIKIETIFDYAEGKFGSLLFLNNGDEILKLSLYNFNSKDAKDYIKGLLDDLLINDYGFDIVD